MQGTVVSRTLQSLPGLSGSDPAQDRRCLRGRQRESGPACRTLPRGEWIGIVGATDLGFEAAAGFGVDLERTIVVPHPGEHWLSVTAKLVDGDSCPGQAAGSDQRASGGADQVRLRQKDATLICWGEWPRCEARLAYAIPPGSVWGRGYGHLTSQRGVASTSTGEARRLDRLICGCLTPTRKFEAAGPRSWPSTRSKQADHDRLADYFDSQPTDHKSTGGGRLTPIVASWSSGARTGR